MLTHVGRICSTDSQVGHICKVIADFGRFPPLKYSEFAPGKSSKTLRRVTSPRGAAEYPAIDFVLCNGGCNRIVMNDVWNSCARASSTSIGGRVAGAAPVSVPSAMALGPSASRRSHNHRRPRLGTDNASQLSRRSRRCKWLNPSSVCAQRRIASHTLRTPTARATLQPLAGRKMPDLLREMAASASKSRSCHTALRHTIRGRWRPLCAPKIHIYRLHLGAMLIEPASVKRAPYTFVEVRLVHTPLVRSRRTQPV